MAITLKDIARECGLAVSTVSNILNNHESSFASEEVRTRVRNTAQRLGYKKDYLSSSLRTRRTQSVGLVVDQLHQFTRQDFVVPFVEQFGLMGFEVSVAEHRSDPDRAIGALQGFAERFKDGVLLFTDLFGRPESDQERLRHTIEGLSLKVLGVGSRLRGLVPSLDIDRGFAADRTIEHFMDQGHRNILMVYEYDWDLRPSFRYWDQPGITFWAGIHEPADFLARAAASWSDFDAIFFRTDRIAIPALSWLRGRGVRVPEDIEIVSFDNFPFTEFTSPALSTWDIGFHRLGQRAQEGLAKWMAGEAPAADSFESFQPNFVARESHRGTL